MAVTCHREVGGRGSYLQILVNKLSVERQKDLTVYANDWLVKPFCLSMDANIDQRSQPPTHPWYSGSTLDYWSTSRVIDPAPGI